MKKLADLGRLKTEHLDRDARLRLRVLLRDGFTCVYCRKASPNKLLMVISATDRSKKLRLSSLVGHVTACRSCKSQVSTSDGIDAVKRRTAIFEKTYTSLKQVLGEYVALISHSDSPVVVRQARVTYFRAMNNSTAFQRQETLSHDHSDQPARGGSGQQRCHQGDEPEDS